jgi:membrane protein DedA with SNARE-associated domain
LCIGQGEVIFSSGFHKFMNAGLFLAFFKFVAQTTYAGVLVIMFFDNTILPFPGEIFLLFSGYLIAQGQMSFTLTVLAAVIGCVLGNFTGYEIGRRYGEASVERYGKYVLLGKRHLHLANSFFQKYGAWAILYARFIPAVGHLVSLPAGAARMHRGKFILFSALAALLWYLPIIYLTVVFSRRWEMFLQIFGPFQNMLLIAAAVAAVAFLFFKFRNSKR